MHSSPEPAPAREPFSARRALSDLFAFVKMDFFHDFYHQRARGWSAERRFSVCSRLYSLSTIIRVAQTLIILLSFVLLAKMNPHCLKPRNLFLFSSPLMVGFFVFLCLQYMNNLIRWNASKAVPGQEALVIEKIMAYNETDAAAAKIRRLLDSPGRRRRFYPAFVKYYAGVQKRDAFIHPLTAQKYYSPLLAARTPEEVTDSIGLLLDICDSSEALGGALNQLLSHSKAKAVRNITLDGYLILRRKYHAHCARQRPCAPWRWLSGEQPRFLPFSKFFQNCSLGEPPSVHDLPPSESGRD